jgi:hypothetical protein
VAGISIASRLADANRRTLDGLRPKKFKMDSSLIYNHTRRLSVCSQNGKGNFAVNSRINWRILAALSKTFLDMVGHGLHGFLKAAPKSSMKICEIRVFFLVRFSVRRVL